MSAPPPSPTLITTMTKAMYNARAPTYDHAADGWHISLGLDFITWLSPIRPGCCALDLACGTGLVTLPLASAIGPSGRVLGIDISSGMLAAARAKAIPEGSAPISWIEGEIADLSSLSNVQDVHQERGGFDIIALCSALVLLPPATIPNAISHWTSLLRPGGRLIIDIPTEDNTLQHLFTGALRNAVGIPLPYDRSWVKSPDSLSKLFQEAGLEVERSWRTRSYLPERWYEADQASEVLEAQIANTYKAFAEHGKVEEARKIWPAMWKENLRENGEFWDGHCLYVTIGRKSLKE